MKEKTNRVIEGMRGYLIDCHRNDLQQVNFEGFDREQYRRLIRNSNIDNIMIYAKDHWGFAYYPSQIGPVHPKLEELNLDYTGEVKAIAEEEGVGVCVYYSIDTDHTAAKMHPKWHAIDPYGNEVRAGGRWFRCSITHGYREYALAQIEEILVRYHPSGVFFDCFPSVICFCPECQAYYKGVMGKDMPLEDDVNVRWRELKIYEERYYWLPFAKKLRELFDRVSPGTMLTTNGGNANMPKSIRQILDYHFAEPWAGNYLSSGFSRDTMVAPQIGPGNVGFVYDAVPVESIAKELLSIGIQGARPFLYSESMRNDGSLESHELERVGKVYKIIKDVEAYWKETTFLTDIEILYSDLSHVFAPEQCSYSQDWWGRESKHLDNVQACMALATSMHRGYRIIEGDSLMRDQIHQDSLLLLPNARILPSASWQILNDFICSGGKAIVCLDGPMVDENGIDYMHGPWEELLGCALMQQDNKYVQNGVSSYLQFPPEAHVEDTLKQFPLAVSGPRLIVKPKGAEVLANLMAPVFEVNIPNEQWMAWRPPNPSREDIIGPAILRNRVGAGEVWLITFDIFGMARGSLTMETGLAIQGAHIWHWPSQVLKTIVKSLSEPKITIEGISEDTCVSYRIKDCLLFVHILNGGKKSEAIYNCTITINQKLLGKVNKAQLIYPNKCDISVEKAEHAFRIPIVISQLYTIVKIQMNPYMEGNLDV